MKTSNALIFVGAAFMLWKAAAKYLTPAKPTENTNPVTVAATGSTMGATN